MKRNNKNTVHIGQRLLVLIGQTTNSSGRTKNVWENHGTFLSRQLAYVYAKRFRSGKKVHIEGVRIDISPRESQRRAEEQE
jgi:hypothetical protein